MKKLNVILLSGVVFALAGCEKQGGSSDPNNTESGTASKPKYDRGSITNDNQGGARSPGRINTGEGYSTNSPGLGTNDQGGAANSYRNDGQPTDPERTNNVPKN